MNRPLSVSEVAELSITRSASLPDQRAITVEAPDAVTVRPAASVASIGVASSNVEVRRLARVNALKVTDAEHSDWLRERHDILRHKFDRELTDAEKRRLNYINWNVDRIQDARSGETLDALESFTARYEQFKAEIGNLIASLEAHAGKPQKRG